MRTFLIAPLILLLCSIPACLSKDSSTVSCTTDSQCTTIDPGLRCDPTRHVCTCEGSSTGCGNSGDGGGLDGPGDAPTSPLDSPTLDTLRPDAPAASVDTQAIDTQAVDGFEAVDANLGSSIDTAVPDAAVDAWVPDAEGSCGVNGDCPDPTKAFCVAFACVGCQLAGVGACSAPTPTCDATTGKCVGCTSDDHCTSGATPICDKTKESCAACGLDSQCQAKNAALPACRTDGQCVQCTATAASACTGTTPVCNTPSNTCVECVHDGDCAGTTPLCGSDNKCHGCAADADCGGLADANRSACATSGACVQCTSSNASKCSGATSVCNATSNQCVQCLSNATCSGTTPVCAVATNTCRACAASADCASFSGDTACAATGACVECTDNSTCSGTKPICQTSSGGAAVQNTCRACQSDGECVSIGPGVCMLDGHCATDAETIYVGAAGTATCSSSNPGTPADPVCSLAAGVGLAKSGSKPLVVVRGSLAPGSTTIAVNSPLAIVGKTGATLVPADPGADCITITQGEITLRNLSIQGSISPASGMGIDAAPPSGSSVILHMDTCAVRYNPGGGILLNGAAFDIRNTVVSGNGPGTVLATGLTWGGVYVQTLAASGPANFELVSIQSNNGGGLTCTEAVQASGLLATLNTGTVSQVGSLCAITTGSCPAASTSCGAQSQPQ